MEENVFGETIFQTFLSAFKEMLGAHMLKFSLNFLETKSDLTKLETLFKRTMAELKVE